LSALIEEIASAFGATRALSDTDLGIIEAMIEIGASTSEIVETFGYSHEEVEDVRAKQAASTYRVPPM
jgi:crotonobetainyl-CoA:carnitine CoA-transferase CaiB-like acyl-CoA transferase